MPDRPPFRWDRAAGRYRDARGAFVPPARVRVYLDSALESAGKRMDTLANQLRAGEIDLVSWEVRMRRDVKVVSLYSGAAAKGGWAQLTEADLGRIGRYVQDQYRYLRGFMRDVATGKQAMGGVNNRARLYAEAGRVLHHRFEKAEKRVRGETQRKCIRSATDSCDGCVSAALAGWRDLDDPAIPEIGARQCKNRCRCMMLYRKPEETEE